MDSMKLNPPEEHIKLSACPHCGRTFNASAYEKHVNVCENVTKKRRVFDSSRQRRVGIEYAPPSPINVKELKAKLDAVTNDVKISALDNNTSAPEKTIIPKKKPEKPATVIPDTIESKPASKPKVPSAADGEKPSVGGIPKRNPSGMPPKLQECQFCHRSFNPKAYDNHVKWCQEKSAESLFQNKTNETNVKAMERMKARMQYKPPLPKSKRANNNAAAN